MSVIISKPNFNHIDKVRLPKDNFRIEECTCSCSSKNKNILDCWNMFQTAIIAYGENRENDSF